MNYGKNSDWKIEFDVGFADDLKRLSKTEQKRIKKYLDKLHKQCSDPKERGEPLRAKLVGFWKYRVGNYRLLCQIVDSHVIVLYLLAALHRSKSYSDKNVDELLKRAKKLRKKI